MQTGQKVNSLAKTSNAPTAATPLVPTTKRPREEDDSQSSRKAAKLTYTGTARPTASLPKPAVQKKVVTNGTKNHVAPSKQKSQYERTKPAPATGTAAPKKRGFASLMAKAAAAQEASKATGPDMIKHKAVDKLSRREKVRQAQENEQAALRKPTHGKRGPSSQNSESGSRPTSSAGPKVVYQGTMRANAVKSDGLRKAHKGAGQDRYGGYASWSDLDDAEDDQQSYDSGSDMEGGFDEVMEEEQRAARIARREDEEAQAEEERHRQEKLERKKRLMALNSSAAAAKKRF